MDEIKIIAENNNRTNLAQHFYKSNTNSISFQNFDTSKVTTMREIFYGCESLTSLDLSNFNTNKVTDMDCMFSFCYFLASLNISSFDLSNVTNADAMFVCCKKLTNLKFGKNLKVSLSFRDCPLTHESALSVINGLTEVKEQQIVTFCEETYATLSKEEIKQAEDINWKININ